MAKVNRFETPLLRVSRPVSACQRCRSAKVRCDGKLPACTACERAGKGADCSSANDQFARGKERSYVSSLENRIEKLERQITQAKSRKADANAIDMFSAQSLLAPPALVHGYTDMAGGKVQRKENQDVNDLVSDFGFLSVNATARDFHGFTKQMSFARLVLSTSSRDELPVIAVNTLPQRHVTVSLAKNYLDRFHSLYPFLSETKLFSSIDAVYQERRQYADPIDHWMTRMVIAIACASMSREKGDVQYQDAVRHAVGALEHVESVVRPGSIVGIQAILLLVLYAMLDPHHFNSWYLIGLASRVMVDIGMHQDPPKESKLKEAHQEMQRRVFASVYALDRSISMVHRRGFSFTDDSAGIAHPLIPSGQDNHRDGKQVFSRSLEAAIQLNRLRQIQSSAYQKIFQSDRPSFKGAWPLMCSALQDMRRWSKDLPENLPEDELGPLRRQLHSDTLFNSILLLSPSLDGNLCDYGKFLIFEYAADYADIMNSLIGQQGQTSFITYHDMLATSFIGDRLIRLFYTDSAILFREALPQVPKTSVPQCGPLTIPARTVGERVNRAHGCLTSLERALGRLGSRFGYSEPLDEFRAQSSGARHLLQNTYDRWSRSLGFSRSHYVSTGAQGDWMQHP